MKEAWREMMASNSMKLKPSLHLQAPFNGRKPKKLKFNALCDVSFCRKVMQILKYFITSYKSYINIKKKLLRVIVL